MRRRIETPVLTAREVQRLLDWPTAIRSARTALVQLARGAAAMPPKLYLDLPRGDDFRAMPAFISAPAACGVKWVNVHARNPRRGLPTVMGVIILNDPATGEPLAVLDGLWITKVRTAAAAAVAAQVLSRPNSRTVALVGCGAQADAQLLALYQVRAFQHVRVWSRGRGEAARFCATMRRRLPGVRLQPSATVRAAVDGADLIVTLTPSRTPLVRSAWVAPGTHINAIGADAPGKQELETALVRRAAVIVDDREQALHAGEINVPISRGQYTPSRIRATLGEVLSRRRLGRRTSREITVFDATGLAVHDVALAAEVYRRALRRRIGRRVPLVTS